MDNNNAHNKALAVRSSKNHTNLSSFAIAKELKNSFLQDKNKNNYLTLQNYQFNNRV